LVIDFVRNLAKHPPVEEIEWDPEEYLAIPREREKEEALTKLCPKCDRVNAISNRVCGGKNWRETEKGCGHPFPRKEGEEEFIDWEEASLRLLHTKMWVEIGGSAEFRDDRFRQVVRDKWLSLQSKRTVANAPRLLSELKAWAKQFESELRASNPSFVAPDDAIAFPNLARCWDHPVCEFAAFQMAAFYSGQSYWDHLVLSVGARLIDYMCSEEYSSEEFREKTGFAYYEEDELHLFGQYADIAQERFEEDENCRLPGYVEPLKARRKKEEAMLQRAVKMYDRSFAD
jgi:hypothetical protein